MPDNKHKKRLLLFAYAAAAYVILRYGLRYLFPWFAPFLLAAGTAILIEPLVSRLSRRTKIRRVAFSAVCTFVVTAAVLAFAGLIVWEVYGRLSALADELPGLFGVISRRIGSLSDRIDGMIARTSPEVERFLSESLDSISESAAGIPAALSGKLLTAAANAASAVPKVLLFTAAYIISTFFMSSSYGDIKAFLLRQLPERRRDALPKIRQSLSSAVGKWLRAELILIGVTFTELWAAFLLLRVEGAFGAALLVSVVDALPVLGVGTVLVPWAFAELLRGCGPRAAALIAIYCVCSLVRSFLEPKLLGTRSGLHPVATIIAVYLGFSCAGVVGMILFPVTLIMAKQLQDAGLIHLWK